jgi:hypothetical protein
MQKLVNVIALLSGLVSLSVVGAGSYLYLNKDAMIEDARVKVTEEITKAITEALPGMIDSALPEMPDVTGGVIPESAQSVPNVTGGVVPF